MAQVLDKDGLTYVLTQLKSKLYTKDEINSISVQVEDANDDTEYEDLF